MATIMISGADAETHPGRAAPGAAVSPGAPPVHPRHVVVASRRRRLAVCVFHAGDWTANPMRGLAGTDRIDGLCGQPIRYEAVYTDGTRAHTTPGWSSPGSTTGCCPPPGPPAATSKVWNWAA